MNNKEFIAELASRLGRPVKEVTQTVAAFAEEVSAHLEEGDSIAVTGFGTFEVKKKLERVVVNPATRQRMLVPPKMVVNFKPSTSLKDKTQDNG